MREQSRFLFFVAFLIFEERLSGYLGLCPFPQVLFLQRESACTFSHKELILSLSGVSNDGSLALRLYLLPTGGAGLALDSFGCNGNLTGVANCVMHCVAGPLLASQTSPQSMRRG